MFDNTKSTIYQKGALLRPVNFGASFVRTAPVLIFLLFSSAGALMMGMVIGGVARLSTDNLKLFEFVSLPALMLLLVNWIALLIRRLLENHGLIQ
jgi:hypothetical protein